MSKSPDMKQQWRVWGRVLGPALPKERVRFGNVVIGPKPKGVNIPKPSAPTLTAETDVNYRTSTAPQLHIESDCWLMVDGIEANSADEAIAYAATAEVPSLMVALSHQDLVHPYITEIVGADDGATTVGDSAIVSIQQFAKDELPIEWVEFASSRKQIIESNPQLLSASNRYYAGLTYEIMTAGPLVQASSLLAYFQVLEACSIIPPWSKPDSFEEDRAKILSQVTFELGTKTNDNKRAQAVQSAVNKLNQLENKYLSLRIKHAADAFGLGKAWVNRAQEFGKLRNQRLGHAGSPPTEEIMRSWIGSNNTKQTASELAREMIDAAVSYVAKD